MKALVPIVGIFNMFRAYVAENIIEEFNCKYLIYKEKLYQKKLNTTENRSPKTSCKTQNLMCSQ